MEPFQFLPNLCQIFVGRLQFSLHYPQSANQSLSEINPPSFFMYVFGTHVQKTPKAMQFAGTGVPRARMATGLVAKMLNCQRA